MYHDTQTEKSSVSGMYTECVVVSSTEFSDENLTRLVTVVGVGVVIDDSCVHVVRSTQESERKGLITPSVRAPGYDSLDDGRDGNMLHPLLGLGMHSYAI